MMLDFVVNDEQARLIVEACTPIAVRDQRGRVIGRVVREVSEKPCAWSAEQVAELERRLDSAGPWYSTQKVLEHLSTLESK